jgi:rhodanese-related sulfurtransferase
MIRQISAVDLLKRIENSDNFKLVDVLLPSGYAKWHIPGAINIQIDELENLAPKMLDKQDEIIVYCASFECQSSTRAAKILETLGFTNVSEYKGGKKEWMEKNYPIEEGK